MISQGSLHLLLLKPNRLHSYPKKALLIFISTAGGRQPEKVPDIFPGAPVGGGANLLFILFIDSGGESTIQILNLPVMPHEWGRLERVMCQVTTRPFNIQRRVGYTCRALPRLWFQPLSLDTPWAAMVQRRMSS